MALLRPNLPMVPPTIAMVTGTRGFSGLHQIGVSMVVSIPGPRGRDVGEWIEGVYGPHSRLCPVAKALSYVSKSAGSW
jgi:hypothetical protein